MSHATTTDEVRVRLGVLYQAWAGRRAADILPLPRAGSDRMYYRLGQPGPMAIGVFNADARENEAFVSFGRHFHALGLPVPEIYATDLPNGVYLQQDLGDLDLLQHLTQARTGPEFPASSRGLYEASLSGLARLQVLGAQGLDFSKCQPRAAFDLTSMRWDLAYFKYYFLKLVGGPFDEQALEDDFEALAHYLCGAAHTGFMHRDFQARNIMVQDGRPYFIDFQGGRRGALQYDLASLLFQAKARIPEDVRAHLIDHYLNAASALLPIDRAEFMAHFSGFVLIRTLQVLGAYGLRGLYERRPHFLESIPPALDNLAWCLANLPPVALPTLLPLLEDLLTSPAVRALGRPSTVEPATAQRLTLRIRSFSYKQGQPEDPSGNGGGFVFDCRAILNPGRFPAYKTLTGRDQPVKDFLTQHTQIASFLDHAYALVAPAIEDYLQRGFTDLHVAFGCTGGQHRSVYSADALADRIRRNYPITIDLLHVEQEKKNWNNAPA
jgi:aminoglycoside/choline kinase family phosphotransferase